MNPIISEIIKIAVTGSPVASILVKVTLIMVLALAAMRLAQRSRAAVRHTLLIAALALVLMVPIVSMLAPSIRVSVPIHAREQTVRSSFKAELPKSVVSETTIDAADQSSIAQTSQASPSATLMLFAIWVSGAIVFLLPIAGGLWQSRLFRRAGVPWPEAEWTAFSLAIEAENSRRVRVLVHESVSGPMTELPEPYIQPSSCPSMRPAGSVRN